VPSKPRRLVAGLALPTAAAVALLFAAAAGAVSTSPKGPSTSSVQNAGSTVAQPAVVESADLRSERLGKVAASEAAASAKTAVASRAHAVAVANAKAAAGAKAAASAHAAAAQQAAVRAQAFARTQVVARSLARKKIAAPVAAPASQAHGWQLPVSHPRKTSGFGYRWGRLHAGEDFGMSVGTPLGSMSAGKVTFAGVQSGYGNIVQIRYWDGTISYFGHMSSISVHVGQSVSRGQIVGKSGNTGHSTGPHLHLEIHPNGGKAIDPLPWLARHHISP
jgi:murein DD-endopeptidase MepM/ murein hydrolase activator NlpD